jgi:hypothetical protein
MPARTVTAKAPNIASSGRTRFDTMAANASTVVRRTIAMDHVMRSPVKNSLHALNITVPGPEVNELGRFARLHVAPVDVRRTL